MRPFLARFSEPVWSGHLASWADFITTTPELEFSVHTADFDTYNPKLNELAAERKRVKAELARIAACVYRKPHPNMMP